ncbi:MAG TPA: molybdopterin-dependent oxidoreductase [candidate division Zixibacteria bacterium]|nr:molybdopterin-dependent oxidoreductase [candidate division Zixibacteria bacterium]
MRRDESDHEDVWIPTTCGSCYSVCALKVHRVNGTIVKIEGNPDSPTNRGRLCPRGVAGIMTLYNPDRVDVPLRRTNPRKGLDIDPGWVEISWEEALDTIAARLRKIREEDPRKLLLTGTVTTQDEVPFAKIFAMAFGTPNGWNSGAGNHCGTAEHLYGALLHASWAKQPDPDHCKYLLNFGTAAGFGSYYCVTGMAQRIADARVRGMRHVAIDPFLSPSAEKADEWIPIRPGTDGAMALAMLHVLLHELRIYDGEYLKRHTNAPYLIGEDGLYVRDSERNVPLVWDAAEARAKRFDAPEIGDFALEGEFSVGGRRARPAFALLEDHLRRFTPEWAEPITTVPAATIRRIAGEFGREARIGSTIVLDGKVLPYRPVAVTYFKGAQGHKNALLNCMALELLVEVVGASNVPGGLLGMNSCSFGHPETGEPRWIPKSDKDGLLVAGKWPNHPPPYPPREVKGAETIDLRGMIPTCPGSSGALPAVMADPGRFKVPYRIEMNLQVGSNYVMTFADPEAVAKAFQDVFQVSFALFLDEATYLSDIVLPAASYLERFSHSTDWMASNSPVGEWSYHLRQPVVETIGKRRSVCEVLLDLAERLEMREEFYAMINVVLDLKPPHALDPARRVTWEQIVDRRYRSLFGDARGLEWFKEHGLLKWPKKIEEVYWKPFSHARVPVYFEWFKRLGENVAAAAAGLGIDIDTTAFQPLPEWRPCRSHREPSPDHDLYAIYYKFPLQTFSGTYDNPWLDEACEIDRLAYRVAINAGTAAGKGIRDGDWLEIESAATGHKIRGRAAVTEGIHPEVIGIAGCGGHWSKFLRVASREGKGLCFEWLTPVGLDNVDIPSLTQDLCVKVRVQRAERAA